jgi:hypothetical protein
MRQKGDRIEREFVKLHQDLGVRAERVPLSGASGYRGSGHDVDIYPFGSDAGPLVFEVKARRGANGFRILERWLADFDGLALRRDRQHPLVVLAWHAWATSLAELKRTREELEQCRDELRRLKGGPPDAIFAKPVVSAGDSDAERISQGPDRPPVRGLPPPRPVTNGKDRPRT